VAEIKSLLAQAVSRLAGLTSTSSLDAQVLLAHVLDCPKSWLMAHPEAEPTPDQAAAYENALMRLLGGEPLPYILGHWEFYGLDFIVDSHVLIPRPETELLVETALAWLRENSTRRRVIDIGAGSGCIGIALAKHIPDLDVTAVDLSPAALEIIHRNAMKHGVEDRVRCLSGDLFSALASLPDLRDGFDLICANLPYIPRATLAELDVANHEPRLALDGGPDGLQVIRRFLADSPAHLAPGGLLLAEIEAHQGSAVLALAEAAFPTAGRQMIPDLAGRDRLLRIERQANTPLISGENPDAILQAIQVLRQGGLVAFPTDTVYGLAADAFRSECIEKLFIAKGRDSNKAIAVLVGDFSQLTQVAAQISVIAERLAQRFWPGPLTLVVPRRPDLPAVLSPLPTVGVRMPDHPLALALLKQTGPLAVTSANISGASNPLTAQDVLQQLDGRIDLILDGGVTPGGVPSTVVDCTTADLVILRQGPITREMML
jgi:release factor-specific protein-(glutamine-N5) methyltransferase/tRNA threonylcarbamoyl adenosine modification protein (Sua5/YciO/YrdC/YwlC family)